MHYCEEIPVRDKALITNLQDFVVHDGPGLRVLVFFKGCPLRCEWCQNPENLAPFPEIEYRASRCLGCLHCMEVCPIDGAIVHDKEVRIDRNKCIKCMRCTEVCRGKALREVGEWLSAEALVDRVLPYKPFFDGSDHGGVTLSGGEPIFQPEFILKLLRSFREAAVHTAVQTCGYTSYEILKEVAQAADLMLYDVKHMDAASHIIGTGKSNDLILNNLARLCKEVDTEMVVRIPLICGFNDDEGNVRASAEYVRSLERIIRLDLLPFNELAAAKYRAMGLQCKYEGVSRQGDEHLARLREIVESYGLKVTIGGLW